jgi:hypothetical protein
MIAKGRASTLALVLLAGILASCRSAEGPATTAAAVAATLAPEGCTIAGTGRDDVLRGRPGATRSAAGRATSCGARGDDVLLGGGGATQSFGGAGDRSALTRIDLLEGAAERAISGEGLARTDATPRRGPGDELVPTAWIRSSWRRGHRVCAERRLERGLVPADGDLDLLMEATRGSFTTGDNQYEDGELDDFRPRTRHLGGA